MANFNWYRLLAAGLSGRYASVTAFGGRDSTLSKVDVAASGLVRRLFDSDEQSGFVQNGGGLTERVFLNGGVGSLAVAGGARTFTSPASTHVHGLAPYVPTCIVLSSRSPGVEFSLYAKDGTYFEFQVSNTDNSNLAAATYFFDFLAFRIG